MSRLKTDAIRNVNASVDGITLDTSGNVAIPNELQLADKIVHTGDTNTFIRFPAADVIAFETGGTERLRINSDGRIWVNTQTGSSATELLRVENTGSASTNSRISIVSGGAAQAVLLFGDDQSFDQGQIVYSNTDHSMRFHANAGNERLRITSIGRLLIGTSTANKAGSYSTVVSTGGSANNGGFMAHYNTGAYGGGSMTTANGGGGGLIFWTYTGNLGSESYSERLRITSAGNVGIGCTPSNGFLEVKNTSYNGGSTGFLTLEGGGESGVMFKTSSYGNDQNKIGTNNNGHMFFRVAAGTRASLTSNGLCFNSDTAAANALNDYEEGTFTITVGTTGNAPTISGTSSWTGQYTKIGKVVHVNGYIASVNVTNAGTGSTKISGLPFASAGDYCAIAITHNDLTAHDCEGGYIGASQSHFFPIQPGSTSGSAPTTGFKFMMFAGTYLTDA